MKHGIVIGRFQPFHLGHQLLFSEVIALGMVPVAAICTSSDSKKNPYSYTTRREMVRSVFPEVQTFEVMDCGTNEEWAKNLTSYCARFFGDYSFFIHKKDEDLSDVSFNGKTYENSHWSVILDNVHEATYPKLLHLDVSGTKVRADTEANKHLLDGRVYNIIKRIK